MAGVRQNNSAQINGGRRGINRAPETLSHQSWNPAAVVEVRVGQNYGVNAACRDRHRLPVALSPLLRALEHAAIDEHLKPGVPAGVRAGIRTGVDQVLRAGNGASRAPKLYVGQIFPPHELQKSISDSVISDCRL